jgi:hypothetical protein
VDEDPQDAPDVAIAIVTRGERHEYLARTLKGILVQRKSVKMDVAVWFNSDSTVSVKADWVHRAGHNMGQHIAMNAMLDRACNLNARYFLRVDDDCFTEKPKMWISRLVRIADKHEETYKTPCFLAPKVRGLKFPPAAIGEVRIGKMHLHLMEMLGGICRLHPMSVMHDWRWNVRLPMGFGEANQIASIARQRSLPMLRDIGSVVSHGGSTGHQEERDPKWKAEHDRLQVIPYGL